MEFLGGIIPTVKDIVVLLPEALHTPKDITLFLIISDHIAGVNTTNH
jgi:hypothetical protein